MFVSTHINTNLQWLLKSILMSQPSFIVVIEILSKDMAPLSIWEILNKRLIIVLLVSIPSFLVCSLVTTSTFKCPFLYPSVIWIKIFYESISSVPRRVGALRQMVAMSNRGWCKPPDLPNLFVRSQEWPILVTLLC